MKQIIFVRHAQAETDNYDTDFERNLTEYGKQTAELVVGKISEKNIKPDQIITSPANRAMQTSEIFANKLNYPHDKISNNYLLYSGFTTIDLLEMISKINNDYNCIMIISHNPDISTITKKLILNSDITFKPSTTIGIEFNVDDWNNVKIRQGKLFLFEQI